MKIIHSTYIAFLLFFFLFAIRLPKSQTNAQEPPWLKTYHKAEAFYNSASASDVTDSMALAGYKQVIQTLRVQEGLSTILLDSYLKTGILLMMQRQKESALDYFKEAISLKQRHTSVPDSVLFKHYIYAGSIYYEQNNLDSAFWFYKQAENILTRFPAVSESERLYNKLGVLYYETGDYRKSIPYFTKALSTIQSRDPSSIFLIINYRNNIATSLQKLGYTDSAISIYKELLPFHVNETGLLHNIGAALLDEGKNAEALAYLEKANYESPARYNHLAQAYLGLQNFTEAELFVQKSFALLNKKKNGAYDFDYANVLKLKGDILIKKGKVLEAAQLYQRSIMQLKPDFKDSSIYSNPSSFISLHNSFALFNVLVAKARALKISGVDNHLFSFQTYSSALQLARQLELRYGSDEARLFLNSKITPACKEAVDLGTELFHSTHDSAIINKVFMLCEGNKASVLQASLYNLQLDSMTSLPSSLLQESKNVKSLIAKLSRQASVSEDSLSVEISLKKITDLEIQLASIQEKLEEYPAYQQLVFSSREINPDSLRKNIVTADGAMLSYYYTQGQLLCFYITKEMSGFVKGSFDINLSRNINTYRRELDAGEVGDKKLIHDLSSLLFQQLVEPVLPKIKGKKHLIILPYNEISYVPFESLINKENNEYLLNSFALSYEYSANFLKSNQSPVSNSYRVLAFAPFAGANSNESDLPNLPASRAEVESFKGTRFYDTAATKEKFIQLSTEYSVIHLATHARADDIDPLQSYIEFAGNRKQPDTLRRLYEQEIYHLNMKSVKLVVLSACETGAGQLVNGEGIMSLSRAFSYAGCRSVITSLWRAEDEATSFICRRLHHYLVEGKAIDEALQMAKLDFLNSDKISSRFKIPSFWAHLVLIGDYQNVNKPGISTIRFWIGGILLIILVPAMIFILKKRRK